MTTPESLTPVGDLLALCGTGVGYGPLVFTHGPGCARWHPWCAYTAGQAEALRQLAADLEEEAADIAELGEVPWAAMLGVRITDPKLAAALLRRAAEVARLRAERPQNVPGRAPASQSRGPAGDPAVPP